MKRKKNTQAQGGRKNRFELKDLFLGDSDGYNEATYKDDFDDYFYNHDNIFEKIVDNPKLFLILGRKGTGMSILAYYIKKKAQGKHDWFAEVNSYKEFRFHELLHLKDQDLEPNEYLSIWEWIVLLDIGRMCLKDQSISDQDEYERFRKFACENFSLDLAVGKVVEVTREKSTRGGLKLFSRTVGNTEKIQSGTYLELLEAIRSSIGTMLKSSECRYSLIYDDLDERFYNDKLYKELIICLVKVVSKLNRLFAERRINAKIILLIRTDIFSILNYPNLNKLRIDNAITLNWVGKLSIESPIFKLLANKIRRSSPFFRNMGYVEIATHVFPDRVRNFDALFYILQRTLQRPRDIIAYLRCIQETYPRDVAFRSHAIVNAEIEYSKYFLNEFRNELCGHLEDTQIDQGITLLKLLKLNRFSYRKIESYVETHKSLYPNIDVRQLLEAFFRFGIIGNRWSYYDKVYYSWKFRNEEAVIDYDKEFVLHFGMHKATI